VSRKGFSQRDMSETRIRYRTQGVQTILSTKHDWAEVCNHIQRKLFPDVTEEERRADRARADAIMKKARL